MSQAYPSRRRFPVILPLTLVALGLASRGPRPVGASEPARPAGGQAITFRIVHGWPELPPGEILGQATGVGVDSRGNVLVFHRAGRVWAQPFPTEPIARPTVWVFDGKTGHFLRSWGAGMFVMPHGLTVDHDDNVWLTDVGLHQVFKFSSDGRPLLKIGEAGIPGADAGHFNLPTDVAVLRDGSFLVSDGYKNTRIVKFAADGTFLLTWGTPGTGPGQFNLPHGIDVDDSGRVYVADRGNSRVQVFDANGQFLAEWRGPEVGRPYAVALSAGGRAYVADGGDQPTAPPDRSGVAVLDRDGKVLTRFGSFGNYDGQFRLAHDIAVGRDGAAYVVDAWGQRVQKFLPR
jgi:peptidylamidoglycolate lyase